MHDWYSKLEIWDWGLDIGNREYAEIGWNRLEQTGIDWSILEQAGIGRNRHIQAYSILCLPGTTFLYLFQSILVYSSLLQSIPEFFSLFRLILAYSSLFQPIPAFSSLCHPIPSYIPIPNLQSPIPNLQFEMSNWAFYPQLDILSVSSLINCCCRPNGLSLTPLIEEHIANFGIPLAVFDVCPFFICFAFWSDLGFGGHCKPTYCAEWGS